MVVQTDRIASRQRLEIFTAEREPRVVVEQRVAHIERTISPEKTGKQFSAFVKRFVSDKYYIVDHRNDTVSEGYQNFTAAIEQARKVRDDKYTGKMLADIGWEKVRCLKLQK